MKNKKTKSYIVETLSLNPDREHIGREISINMQRIYNQSASPKKIAKLITQLQEDYPQIQKIGHTPKQCAIYGCRYSYTWDTTSSYNVFISSQLNFNT